MSVTVMLKISVEEKNKDEFCNVLKEHLPQTKEYKGFIDISIYNEIDSNIIILYSNWVNKEDYESYLQWRFETGVMEQLGRFFTSEPNIKYYENLNL